MKYNTKKIKLAIVGLGYVGLPLAIEFAKKRSVIGFDINNKRINQLKLGIDKNSETKKKELKGSSRLLFTSNKNDLETANCYIITVPTPIDRSKKPDLKPLINATTIISKFIKKGDLIIYESTVYPGCIEEQCVPLIENLSRLKFNKEFFCGYSPERMNPGDKKHTVSNIKKITSGSTPKIRDLVDNLYNEIVKVGTHKASSIKVAEAAKVIENTQRDLNIALINELSIIFNKMNIDTQEVLDAASSKWNFLSFKPGLVGGHCIGVDPYYLTFKAKSIGYKPKIILAGRELNDKMGNYVASKLINKMKKKLIRLKGANILIMGLAFKENCSDIRNSGVQNVVRELKKFGCNLDLYDPWVDPVEIKNTFDIDPILSLKKNNYDGVLISVAHDQFKSLKINTISKLCKKKYVIYDLKHIYKKNEVDLRL